MEVFLFEAMSTDIGPRADISTVMIKLAKFSARLKSDDAFKNSFILKPAETLKEYGIVVPAEVFPSPDNLKRILEKHVVEEGDVAIAVCAVVV